jgi:LCP family protein required for cell wall assembly
MTGDSSTSSTAVRDDDRLPSLAGAFVDEDTQPAARRRPVRNALIGVLVCLVVIALTALAVVTVVGVKLSSNLDRIPGVFDSLTNRPTKPDTGPGSQALNILVLGTDRRSEVATTGSDAAAPSWVPGAQRTDALMILHIDGDREAASLISIPRDSWVVVPGYGSAKVNAAFSYGGPTLAVQTVELLTGVRIDHLAVTDWDGFSGLIDALGGVTVKVPESVTDSMHDVTWSAGKHELDGGAALEYVGQRYGLPLGDLDRVRRQQAVFRALATETLRQDPMSDPRKTYGLLDTMTRHLSVDDEWSARDMASVLMSLRGMRGSSIDYLTAPVAGFGDVAGQSIVRLDRKANQALWGAVVTDDVQAWAEHHPSDVTPAVVR